MTVDALQEREPESRLLSQALQEGVLGHGSLVVISGEPGIGKSALADRAVQLAISLGMRVIKKTFKRYEPPSVLVPWDQMVRQGDPVEIFAQAVHGNGASQNHSSPLRKSELEDLDRRLTHFFRVVRGAVSELSRRESLIIVLDDLHRVDAWSLQFLRLLPRHLSGMSLVVLAAYRECEIRRMPLQRAVFESIARQGCHLRLGPLSEKSVERLVEQALGRTPERNLVSWVARYTGGNPLFVNETLPHLSFDGQTDRLPTSDTVRSAVESLLGALSVRARDLASMASAIGEEFDFEVLQRVSGADADRMAEILAEIEDAGIIRSFNGTPCRYAFVHGVVRRVLYDDLSRPARASARRHLTEGEVIEGLCQNVRLAVNFARHGDADSRLRALQLLDAVSEEANALGVKQLEAWGKERGPENVRLTAESSNNGPVPHGIHRMMVAPGNEALRENDMPLSLPGHGPYSGVRDDPWENGTPPTRIKTLWPSSRQRLFRHEGEYWTLGYAGSVVHVKHRRGLELIAHLLRNPGREFHSTDLEAVAAPGLAAGPTRGRSEIARNRASGTGAPVLDNAAKHSYRERLMELRDELEQARSFNDFSRVSQIEHEMMCIARELSRAIGLSGRDRKSQSDSERARIRVTLAIHSAIRMTRKNHEKLGHYLDSTITTGTFCCYRDELDAAEPWEF